MPYTVTTKVGTWAFKSVFMLFLKDNTDSSDTPKYNGILKHCLVIKIPRVPKNLSTKSTRWKIKNPVIEASTPNLVTPI